MRFSPIARRPFLLVFVSVCFPGCYSNEMEDLKRYASVGSSDSEEEEAAANAPPPPKPAEPAPVAAPAIVKIEGVTELPTPLVLSERPKLGNLSAAEQRNHTIRSMRRVAEALKLYLSKNQSFPPLAIQSSEKPLLSWRVHLLPYLGYTELYSRFRLNESWDSEHNRALIPLIPEVYTHAAAPATRTRIMGVDGVLSQKEGVKQDSLKDGPENTLILLEVNESKSVDWTTPGDYAYAEGDTLSAIGESKLGSVLGVLGDASIADLNAMLDSAALKGLTTPNGQESKIAQGILPACESTVSGPWQVKFSASDSTLLAGSTKSELKIYRTDGTPVRDLGGQIGPVADLALSGGNGIAVSGNDNGAVRIWPLFDQSGLDRFEARRKSGGNQSIAFTPHDSAVSKILIDPQSRYFLSADRSGSVIRWNLPLETPSEVRTFPAIPEAMASNDDRTVFASAMTNGEILFTNFPDGRFLQRYESKLTPVKNGLVYLSKVRKFALASQEGPIILIDPETGKLVGQYPGHATPVVSIFAGPEGELRSVGSDGSLMIWAAAASRDERRVLRLSRTYSKLFHSGEGRSLVIAGNEELSFVTDSTSEPRKIAGQQKDVTSIATASNSPLVGTVSNGGLVRLFENREDKGKNFQELSLVSEDPDSSFAYSKMVLDRAGTQMLLARRELIEFWKLQTPSRVEGEAAESIVNVHSGAGRYAISEHRNGDLGIIDLSTNRWVGQIKLGMSPTALAFSSDDQLLFASTTDGRIQGWKLPNGEPNGSIKFGESSITDLQLDQDAKTLAVGTRSGDLVLLPLPLSGGTKETLGRELTIFNRSSNGKWVIGKDDKSRVVVGELGSEDRRVTGLSSEITHACIADRGDVFASIDPSGVVSVGRWQTDQGQAAIANLSIAVEKNVLSDSSLSLSADGETLVLLVGGAEIQWWRTQAIFATVMPIFRETTDGIVFNRIQSNFSATIVGTQVVIHDMRSKDEIRKIETGIDRPLSLAWDQDGKSVAVVGAGGKVRQWNVEDGKLTRELQISPQSVRDVRIYADHMAVLSTSGVVSAWSLADGKELWKRDFGPTYKLGVLAEHDSAAFVLRDNGVVERIGLTDQSVRSLGQTTGTVLGLVEGASLDELFAMTESVVYRLDGKESIVAEAKGKALFASFCFDRYRSAILIARRDGSAQLMNRDGKVIENFVGLGSLKEMTVTEDGSQIVFHAAQREPKSKAIGIIRSVEVTSSGLKQLTVSPDGKNCAVLDRENKLRVFARESGQLMGEKTLEGRARYVRFSADSQSIVVVLDKGSVIVADSSLIALKQVEVPSAEWRNLIAGKRSGEFALVGTVQAIVIDANGAITKQIPLEEDAIGVTQDDSEQWLVVRARKETAGESVAKEIKVAPAAIFDSVFAGKGRLVVSDNDGKVYSIEAETSSVEPLDIASEGKVLELIYHSAKDTLIVVRELQIERWDLAKKERVAAESLTIGLTRSQWSPEDEVLYGLGKDGDLHFRFGPELVDPIRIGFGNQLQSFAVGAAGKLVHLLNGDDSRTLRTVQLHRQERLVGPRGIVTSADIDRTGQNIVATFSSGAVCTWDLSARPVRMREMTPHNGKANSAKFILDSATVLSGGDDGWLRSSAALTGEVAHQVQVKGSVDSIDVSESGLEASVRSTVGEVTVWSTEELLLLHRQLFPAGTSNVGITGAGDQLIALKDGTVIGYFPFSKAKPKRLALNAVRAVAAHGKTMVAVCDSGVMSVSQETGSSEALDVSLPKELSNLEMSGSGKRIAGWRSTDTSEQRLFLRELEAEQNANKESPISDIDIGQSITDVAWSQDEERLCVASGKILQVYEAKSRVLLQRLESVLEVEQVWFSADGEKLISLESDSTMRCYPLPRLNKKKILDGSIDFLEVALGDSVVAVLGSDRVIRVVNLESLEVVAQSEALPGMVTAVSVRPDGKALAVGLSDLTLRVIALDGSKGQSLTEPAVFLRSPTAIRQILFADSSEPVLLLTDQGIARVANSEDSKSEKIARVISPVQISSLHWLETKQNTFQLAGVSSDGRLESISIPFDLGTRPLPVGDDTASVPPIQMVDVLSFDQTIAERIADLKNRVGAIEEEGERTRVQSQLAYLTGIVDNQTEVLSPSGNRSVELLEDRLRQANAKERARIRDEIAARLVDLIDQRLALEGSGEIASELTQRKARIVRTMEAFQKLSKFEADKEVRAATASSKSRKSQEAATVKDESLDADTTVQALLAELPGNAQLNLLSNRNLPMTVTADGKTVVAGRSALFEAGTRKEEGVVQAWDVTTGTLLRSWKDVIDSRIETVGYSPDENLVYTAPDMFAFDLSAGQSRLLGTSSQVALCRAKNLLAIGRETGAGRLGTILEMFDLGNFETRKSQYESFESSVRGLAFSPQGDRLVVAIRLKGRHRLMAFDPSMMQPFRSPSGIELEAIEEFPHRTPWFEPGVIAYPGVQTIALSQNGKVLLTHGHYGDDDYRFAYYSWEEANEVPKLLKELKQDKPFLRIETPNSIRFIGGGRRAVIDSTEGIQLVSFEGPLPSVLGKINIASMYWGYPATGYSLDSRWFAYGDDGGRVALWNLETFQLELTFIAHNGPVVSVGLSDDGRFITTAGQDGKIRVWSRDFLLRARSIDIEKRTGKQPNAGVTSPKRK